MVAILYIGSVLIAYQLTELLAWIFKTNFNGIIFYVLWIMFWGLSFEGLKNNK